MFKSDRVLALAVALFAIDVALLAIPVLAFVSCVFKLVLYLSIKSWILVNPVSTEEPTPATELSTLSKRPSNVSKRLFASAASSVI